MKVILLVSLLICGLEMISGEDEYYEESAKVYHQPDDSYVNEKIQEELQNNQENNQHEMTENAKEKVQNVHQIPDQTQKFSEFNQRPSFEGQFPGPRQHPVYPVNFLGPPVRPPYTNSGNDRESQSDGKQQELMENPTKNQYYPLNQPQMDLQYRPHYPGIQNYPQIPEKLEEEEVDEDEYHQPEFTYRPAVDPKGFGHMEGYPGRQRSYSFGRPHPSYPHFP
ncbi:uncharacterized protein LOC129788051 [Lutzomyia longipalpis]|uniref:uncharacterized protein LOC129788051 n=1 Tax=Lutzomyia longipalpis TaxID=7200 RepID=UPI002483A44B|nr:uncharacterized protein LOC129788051 [Lutzomyia longipalpis]